MTIHNYDSSKWIDDLKRQLDTIIKNLFSLGFKFKNSDGPWLAPSSNLFDQIKIIESEVGKLPKVLTDLYLNLGSIDLRGTHPDWLGDDYPDPLVFLPIEDAILDMSYWLEDIDEYGIEKVGSFELPISMDDYHKEDVSGGPCYSIQLPTEQVDPILNHIWYETTLTGYFEKSLQWAGFCGLSREKTHTWPIGDIIKK